MTENFLHHEEFVFGRRTGRYFLRRMFYPCPRTMWKPCLLEHLVNALLNLVSLLGGLPHGRDVVNITIVDELSADKVGRSEHVGGFLDDVEKDARCADVTKRTGTPRKNTPRHLIFRFPPSQLTISIKRKPNSPQSMFHLTKTN